MKLFINGRFLTQRTSGVQSFAREVCRELLKEIELVILVPSNTTLYDNEFSGHIKRTGFFKGHLWEQISLPLFLLNQTDAKLLNLCNTGPVIVKKQICTIHDLAFLKDPKWFNPLFSLAYTFLIPRLIRASRGVLAVSETIKNELVKEYKLSEKKITVVGNKVAQDIIDAKPIGPFDDRILPKEYFLVVGSDNPRKNLSFVKHIFAEGAIGKKLVVAGGGHRSFSNNERIDFDSDTIIALDYIDNEKLVWLYKNAIGLISPSFYEGFGIPNIEAMMFECPLVCSDIPVFREVCQEAAFYFKLNDAESLKNCLIQDMENKARVEENKAAGRKIVEKFQSAQRGQIILNMLSA
ncbi:MAG: glycosyltransferase family 4 protein [Bacteroidota bacterium]